MVYETIFEKNVTSLDGIRVYVANVVPIFTPVLLICLWIVIAVTIYLGTSKFKGNADIFAAFTVAGFITSIVGTLATLTFGIINVYVISFIVGIFIVSFILLFIKRSRD